MPTCTEITTNRLQYTRFDSEFYYPKYLAEDEMWARIGKRVPVRPLGRFATHPVRTGRTPKNRELCDGEETVVFIKTDTVREGRIDFANCGVLPRRAIRSSDLISSQSILVTIIGATHAILGRAAMREDNDPPSVTNQNVAVIQTAPTIDPRFLMVFLNTRFGRDQIWRHARQTEQVNMNCREVERVLLPQFPPEIQEEVARQVSQSASSLQRAATLSRETESILATALRLDTLDLSHTLGYDSRLSELGAARRWDADFHAPKYLALRKKLQSIRTDTLASLTRMTKGIEVGSTAYREEGPIFARVSTLTPMGVRLGDNEKHISQEMYANLRHLHEPRVDEILLSKDGTPGIACLLDRPLGGIVSSGIVRLSPNEDTDRHYLTAVLNSKVCQMQIGQEASGAVIQHWTPEKMRRLLIPRFEESVERAIAQTNEEAMLARRHSEDLLDNAKRRVEELIEKEAAT